MQKTGFHHHSHDNSIDFCLFSSIGSLLFYFASTENLNYFFRKAMSGIKKFIRFSRRWFQGNLDGIFILLSSQHILITQRTCYITQFFHYESNEKTCGKEFKNIILISLSWWQQATHFDMACIMSFQASIVFFLIVFIDFSKPSLYCFSCHTRYNESEMEIWHCGKDNDFHVWNFKPKLKGRF